MFINKTKRKTYSNIVTKLKNQENIRPSMIVKRDIIDYKRKRSGETEPVYKESLNIDYWKNIKEPINVVLDEAHSIINARRSMSKINIIVTDWLALIRRVLGDSDAGYGELVLITQLPNRIDIIAREMATQIRYHLCHFKKVCVTCETIWQENSDMPEGIWQCPHCAGINIKKFGHTIEVWHFQSMRHFSAWKDFGSKCFYKHYMIRDIEKYFKLYDTLQWDNLFSELYV